MQKLLFFAAMLPFLGQPLLAQAPFFSYNLYRYNPAAAATNSEWAANLEYSAQWAGIPGYTKLSDLNVQKRFAKYHSAIGAHAYTNVQGEGNLFKADYNLSYSYQWKMSQKENSPTLAFGLQSGFSKHIAGFYGLYGYSQQVISGMSLNTGIHFYLPNEKFYAGFSVSDIIQRRASIDYEPVPFFPTSYQFMSGYRFGLGKKLFLQPNMLVKLNSEYNDFCTNVQLQHKKWEAGLSYGTSHPYIPYDYTQQSALGFNAGVCIKKRFYIRYLYNYTLSPLNNSISQGSHSLMLSYRSIR